MECPPGPPHPRRSSRSGFGAETGRQGCGFDIYTGAVSPPSRRLREPSHLPLKSPPHPRPRLHRGLCRPCPAHSGCTRRRRLRTCGLRCRRRPIMALTTPSPEVSPVSAATTNGQFPSLSLPDASNFVLKSALKSPHLLDSPNPFSSSNGFLNGAFKKRPRNMSQSSGTDTDNQPSGIPPTSNGTEPRSSNKKRPSTDTIDYPRRRATIAVLHPILPAPPAFSRY